MGLFSSNDNSNHYAVNKMFNIISEGLKIQEMYKPLSKDGRFELHLFCSNIVMGAYHRNHPVDYNNFEEEYFRKLYSLTNLSSQEFSSFANSRFQFYNNEINLILGTGLYPGEQNTYINGKIYSSFYINPLQENITHSFDLGEILLFHLCFVKMWKHVADESDKV